MREWSQNVDGISPHKTFCGLLFAVVALCPLSETTSLKGKQLDFVGIKDKYASLAGYDIPELCTFTVCIDLNKTEQSIDTWAPFSYDINSSSVNFGDVEMALSVNKSVLQLILLGAQTKLGEDFSAYTMHQVCCTWNSSGRLFELFHNGVKVKSLTLHNTSHTCLKPKGTLVMGHLHKNQNGYLSMTSSFVGILHYFQMWDYVREQSQMASCDEGNVVSWRGDYWALHNVRILSAQHQRCEEAEEETTIASPPPTEAPDAKVAVTFYNIQMNFSVCCKPLKEFDYYDAEKLSANWFKEKLYNSEFVVTNHHIKTNVRRVNLLRKAMWIKAMTDEKQASQRYFSKSIIMARSSQTIPEIMGKLQTVLCGRYEEDSLSMTVETNNVNVAYIDPKACPKETIQSKYKGSFTWPEITPYDVAYHSCEKNRDQYAHRSCLINIMTEKAYWERQNLITCQLLEELPDNIMALKNVTITVENAKEVADHILILLNSHTPSKEEIEVLVAKLTEIANCEEISETVARKALQIINILMTEEHHVQELQELLNRILRLMEQIGFKMEFSGRNQSIVLPSLGMAVLRPDPTNFQGVAFSVMSYNPHRDPELNIHPTPFTTALASIFLPGSLRSYLGARSFVPEELMKIQFSFFGATSLFEDSSFGNEILNTYIVGASIENTLVQNLKEPVTIILQHILRNVDDAPVRCVYWDFKKHNGLGGWDTSGCEMEYTDANYTICFCSHLTHFGVLLDLSRTSIDGADDQSLTLISYVGCGISSIFLGLALVVYLSIEKLRGDYPSRILINLCIALLMLNLTFLVNSWLASFHKHDLCIAVAAVVHYFLLAAFTWMGLEAIHMYYALIKVFNTYIPNYMIKFAIAGWGVPAVIIALVLIISPDMYGTGSVAKSTSSSTLFCWIQDDVTFYISVVAYFGLVFLLNIGMFITVLLQFRAMKRRNPVRGVSWNQDFFHDLKRVASLTFLLGLTWGFAFFAWGPVKIFFMYLFAICNTLQGFFIFIFHCLMKENVRKQCQMHFCCGKFRLSYSHWKSSSTTLGIPRPKKLERKPSCHSLRSLKSCMTSSTSNGSGGLPGTSLGVRMKTGQVCCTSLTCQMAKLPCVRKTSPMNVELEHPQKTRFLH